MKEWPDIFESRDTDWRMMAECTFLIALHLFAVLLFFSSLFAPAPADGHPGGLAADGCHNDRKNGGRHCHGGPNTREASNPTRLDAVYYRNCAAARAAGAAPVKRGQPGYGLHLDRDGDGIGCE